MGGSIQIAKGLTMERCCGAITMAYRETYQGIGFHQTQKGYWFFDEICPNGKHWSRYTEDADLTNLSVESMRRTIDNYKAGRVVYRGDIRDR